MTTFRQFEQAGWSDQSTAQVYHEQVAKVTIGCVPDLLDVAAVGLGARVLDVACGAGYVAAAARDRGAEATGIDFAPAQVRLAEQTYPGIRFMEGDAEALPFPDGNFDAVLNAFGLPHVTDANKVVAEAFRVLKPGGCFGYASWCDVAKCIGFSMVYDAVRAHGTMDVGLPPGPNFFGYGDPSFARELLGRAGFADIVVREVPLVWRVQSPDTVVDGLSNGTVRAAAVIRAQKPEARERIRQHMRDRVMQFPGTGGYAVPSPALVVAGRKP